MKIQVQRENDKLLSLNIPIETTTVEQFKEKIQERTSVQVQNMILILNGTRLEDDKKLIEYGISQESKILQETIQSYTHKLEKRVEKAEEEKQMYQSKLLLPSQSLPQQNQYAQQVYLHHSHSIENVFIQNNVSLVQSCIQIGDDTENQNRMAIQCGDGNTKVQQTELDQIENLKLIEQLKEVNKNMQIKLDEMKDQQNQQNQQIQTLTLQKNSADKEVQLLRDQVSQSQSNQQDNLLVSSQFFVSKQISQTIQLTELKDQVQLIELQVCDQLSLIEQLQDEKKFLQIIQDEYNSMKEELINKRHEMQDLQREIEQLIERNSSSETVLSKELDQYKEFYKQKDQQNKELIIKIQNMELEWITKHSSNVEDQQYQELQNKLAQSEDRLQQGKIQINSLQQQITELQKIQGIFQSDLLTSMNNIGQMQLQERVFELESIVMQNQAELSAKTEAFQSSQSQLSEVRRQLFELNKKQRELEGSIDSLKYLVKQKETILIEKDGEIKNHKTTIAELNQEIEFYKQRNDSFNRVQGLNTSMRNQELEQYKVRENYISKRQEQREREEILRRQEEDKRNSERLIEMKTQQQRLQNLFQKDKAQRNKTAQFLRKQMMETHGKIEVCFLLDITGSMEPYQEQAMNCINESISQIKEKTNRDAHWAAVAYQDFAELKALGGMYRQINFTKNAQEVQTFLKEQRCSGGGDAAEDIRGGMKQMVKNLSWSTQFRIALLICDAPTHGRRYNGGYKDDHLDEDIEDAIQAMIKANIILVGILFKNETLTMFEEIKKIYKSQDKEELLMFSNLEKTQQNSIFQELADLIAQASMKATQTNNSGTKSKLADANKRSQSGAMEALCKLIKNPIEFDKQPGVKIIQADFQVLRVEIKQEAFEAQIENIKNITPKDCAVYREGEWKCVRTQTYFAQGQMKQVFLMKKQNNPNELYVIKMPIGNKTYGSLEQAINECRSHLIAKCLMKKFVREIADLQKIPEPQYSDFLVLQDKPNSFWIAERYFQGEFVKYNNNYGYISDDNSQINHLAQAFTCYTYFISNFKYMISDVQGVGLYFTDPAINTVEGNFDETDMGKNGHSMFMVNWGRKHIGVQFLELLKIDLKL